MKVAVRVDASDQMGTGHLMRCLSIANSLRVQGASVLFICRALPDSLRDLVLHNQHEIAMLRQTSDFAYGDLPHSHWLSCTQEDDALEAISVLSQSAYDWIIVDHYALDFRWEMLIKKHIPKVFVIDDLADRKHDCSVLLDQNFYLNIADRYIGKVSEDCRLLLGPKYSLLRDEFRDLRKVAQRRVGSVQRLLIFLGGVDSANCTTRIIDVVANMRALIEHVDVVIGAIHPYRQTVEENCKQFGFHCHVQTSKIAELMLLADLAIGAGGSATWERCCLGLPTITLSVASNQEKLVKDSAVAGLVYALDVSTEFDEKLKTHLLALIDNEPLRTMLSIRGMDTVDGSGMYRVLSEFELHSLQLRRATMEDAEKVWEWRNSPEIRAVSNQSEPIKLNAHLQWFERALVDTNRVLLIGSNNGSDIGVVRFDIYQDQAEISIYLVPGLIGKGWGRILLKDSERWLNQNLSNINVINANVLSDNLLSSNLFLESSYSISAIAYKKKVL